MTRDQEHEQEIKGQRRHNAHIDGSNRLSVISQKSLPGLRRQLRRSRHIFRDRGLSHLKDKHQKLAMNPGCAPKWVLTTYPPDQISNATINPRPSCPITRLPTPKHFETSAMPTQDGLRLNYLHRVMPFHRSVTPGQPRRVSDPRLRPPPYVSYWHIRD